MVPISNQNKYYSYFNHQLNISDILCPSSATFYIDCFFKLFFNKFRQQNFIENNNRCLDFVGIARPRVSRTSFMDFIIKGMCFIEKIKTWIQFSTMLLPRITLSSHFPQAYCPNILTKFKLIKLNRIIFYCTKINVGKPKVHWIKKDFGVYLKKNLLRRSLRISTNHNLISGEVEIISKLRRLFQVIQHRLVKNLT